MNTPPKKSPLQKVLRQFLTSTTCYLVCVGLLFQGCSGQLHVGSTSYHNDSGRAEKIEITGSSTLGPLANEIGKRFETANPNIRVNIQTGGSSRGIADVASGLADIGMSSRNLSQSEKSGRQVWHIAVDSVGFVVNSKNPVAGLASDQLARIFKGEIANWKQVGGADQPITVINRAAGRSELEMVREFFAIEPGQFDADLIGAENQQVIKMVSVDPNAIGYVSAGAASFAAETGGELTLLSLDGVAATQQNTASGKYPLCRPLILVTPDDASPLVMAFVEFARSPDNHDLIRKLSYVPPQP